MEHAINYSKKKHTHTHTHTRTHARTHTHTHTHTHAHTKFRTGRGIVTNSVTYNFHHERSSFFFITTARCAQVRLFKGKCHLSLSVPICMYRDARARTQRDARAALHNGYDDMEACCFYYDEYDFSWSFELQDTFPVYWKVKAINFNWMSQDTEPVDVMILSGFDYD